jgi:hypothetical protein
VATHGVTPFAALLGKGSMGPRLLARFQLKQALMHPIQGVVDQLGGVFARHGEPQFVTNLVDRATGAGGSPEHASAFLWSSPNIAENLHHH